MDHRNEVQSSKELEKYSSPINPQKFSSILGLLRAMNLTEQDTTNDLVLHDRKAFKERKQFQTDILKSSLCDDRPEGPDLWAVATPKEQVPICHMHVAIALVSASDQCARR